MRTCVRMTSQGSPYQRFRRCVANGNLLMVRAAAAELPRIGVAESAAILLVILRAEPQTYERAALRWVAKLATEARGVDLAAMSAAASALAVLPERPGSRATLAEICEQAGEREAARVFLAG